MHFGRSYFASRAFGCSGLCVWIGSLEDPQKCSQSRTLSFLNIHCQSGASHALLVRLALMVLGSFSDLVVEVAALAESLPQVVRPVCFLCQLELLELATLMLDEKLEHSFGELQWYLREPLGWAKICQGVSLGGSLDWSAMRRRKDRGQWQRWVLLCCPLLLP